MNLYKHLIRKYKPICDYHVCTCECNCCEDSDYYYKINNNNNDNSNIIKGFNLSYAPTNWNIVAQNAGMIKWGINNNYLIMGLNNNFSTNKICIKIKEPVIISFSWNYLNEISESIIGRISTNDRSIKRFRTQSGNFLLPFNTGDTLCFEIYSTLENIQLNRDIEQQQQLKIKDFLVEPIKLLNCNFNTINGFTNKLNKNNWSVILKGGNAIWDNENLILSSGIFEDTIPSVFVIIKAQCDILLTFNYEINNKNLEELSSGYYIGKPVDDFNYNYFNNADGFITVRIRKGSLFGFFQNNNPEYIITIISNITFTKLQSKIDFVDDYKPEKWINENPLAGPVNWSNNFSSVEIGLNDNFSENKICIKIIKPAIINFSWFYSNGIPENLIGGLYLNDVYENIDSEEYNSNNYIIVNSGDTLCFELRSTSKNIKLNRDIEQQQLQITDFLVEPIKLLDCNFDVINGFVDKLSKDKWSVILNGGNAIWDNNDKLILSSDINEYILPGVIVIIKIQCDIILTFDVEIDNPNSENSGEVFGYYVNRNDDIYKFSNVFRETFKSYSVYRRLNSGDIFGFFQDNINQENKITTTISNIKATNIINIKPTIGFVGDFQSENWQKDNNVTISNNLLTIIKTECELDNINNISMASIEIKSDAYITFIWHYEVDTSNNNPAELLISSYSNNFINLRDTSNNYGINNIYVSANNTFLIKQIGCGKLTIKKFSVRELPKFNY